jgi:hypothetical protein
VQVLIIGGGTGRMCLAHGRKQAGVQVAVGGGHPRSVWLETLLRAAAKAPRLCARCREVSPSSKPTGASAPHAARTSRQSDPKQPEVLP